MRQEVSGGWWTDQLPFDRPHPGILLREEYRSGHYARRSQSLPLFAVSEVVDEGMTGRDQDRRMPRRRKAGAATAVLVVRWIEQNLGSASTVF